MLTARHELRHRIDQSDLIIAQSKRGVQRDASIGANSQFDNYRASSGYRRSFS